MSSFHLKLIAVVSMLIDHIGRFFFLGEPVWFVLGRLAFPLFAYLIATGAIHSKNITKYFIRLGIFAVLSQPAFFLAGRLNNPEFSSLNVLFTLFYGLAAIQVWRSNRHPSLRVLGVSTLAIIAEVLSTDYGGLGVLSVFFFYLFYTSPTKMLVSQIIIFCLINISSLTEDLIKYPGMIIDWWYYMPFAIFSLLLISLYNGKEGHKVQYLFYLIYPLHFLIIYFIKTML